MFATKGELALIFGIATNFEFPPSFQSSFQSSEADYKTLIIKQEANL